MRLTILLATCIAAQAADLNQLTFLEGRWRGQIWDGIVEEVWTGPLHGSMVGAFRFVKDGKLVFTEMCKGWEEKNDNVALKLTDQGDRRATFLAVDGDKRMEVRLQRISTDRLEILMIRSNPKTTKEDRFVYTRLP
jgi:hypothetical protein